MGAIIESGVTVLGLQGKAGVSTKQDGQGLLKKHK